PPPDTSFAVLTMCHPPHEGEGLRNSSREVRRPHQELIDRPRAEAPLADRPDDERLSAAHVAGGKHVRPRGLVISGVGPHIAALVEIAAERLQGALMPRMPET